MSQHELSEEQARGIAVNELRRECPEFGGDVPRGWTVKAVQAGYRAGYAAANLAEAERDIARKAWDAAMELARNSDRVLNGFRVVEVGDLWVERDRYLAREYHAPAPEGVTLSDGSVVTRRLVGGAWSWVRERMPNARFRDVQCWPDLLTETDTGADFDALKAFAAKVGAA